MNHLLLLICCLFLFACSEPADTTPPEDRATVFDPLLQDLEKAKAVEALALEQKDKIDEAMKKANGEQDPD